MRTPSEALLVSLLALAACRDELPEVLVPPSEAALGGLYEVEGLTTELASGKTRPIRGAMILARDGARYTATFHLSTRFSGPDGRFYAQVIGKGEGVIEGSALTGRVETQILTAMIPEVDAKFPFLPQVYGPRIESSSRGTFNPDGSILLEIESRAVQGEHYAATRTTMTGRRAPLRGVPGFPETGRGNALTPR